MDYCELGKTGVKVSPICIGAWQLGGPLAFDGKPDGHPDPGRDNVIRMIRVLGELGLNGIDTAEQYSGGESERRVGDAIRGHRDSWVLSTKFGYRVGPGGTREDDSSPPTILPSIEGSLKRLGTDCIDILLYHCAPRIEDLDRARAVLEMARSQGKIRYFGISGNDRRLWEAMQERDMLDVVQYHANLLENDPAGRDFLREHGVGVQVRGVMAQGRLSGKYFQQTPSWGQDDNRSDRSADMDYRAYAPLGELVPEGMTMAQAMIRWTLDQPGHHTICLGAKSLEDYRDALAATDMPSLPDELCRALEQRATELG